MNDDAGIEAAEDARPSKLVAVDNDDRPRLFAQRQPHSPSVRRDGQVVRAGADGEAGDDPPSRELDRHQLAAGVVTDVGPLTAGGDGHQMWGAEVAENREHLERAPVEQGDGMAAGADDHGSNADPGDDVLRVVRQCDAPQHATVVERDRQEGVLGLGGDKGDRPPTSARSRKATRRDRSRRREHDDRQQQSTHAPDTEPAPARVRSRRSAA